MNAQDCEMTFHSRRAQLVRASNPLHIWSKCERKAVGARMTKGNKLE